jgi:hypothetical protein
VFALANPTPFLLARAAIYEAAISGGAGFLCLGLACALGATFADRERVAKRWMLAGSFVLGMAATSRATLFPAAAVVVGMTIAVRFLGNGPRAGRAGWVRLLLLALHGLPFALVSAAHMLANQLRFGSWAEFGQRYQMGKTFKMGPQFIPANIWGYLLRPIERTCKFPFLVPEWHEKARIPQTDHLPGWLPIGTDYNAGEPLSGVLYAAPFVALGLGLLLPRLLRRPPPASEETRRWRWFGWMGLFASGTTMRYEGDFMTPLLLLAILGGWQLLRTPRRRLGRAGAAGLYGALALATVVIGILLGLHGYFDHFGRHNPQLMARWQQRWSLCGR